MRAEHSWTHLLRGQCVPAYVQESKLTRRQSCQTASTLCHGPVFFAALVHVLEDSKDPPGLVSSDVQFSASILHFTISRPVDITRVFVHLAGTHEVTTISIAPDLIGVSLDDCINDRGRLFPRVWWSARSCRFYCRPHSKQCSPV